MLSGKKILLGVCGSIAAYKSAYTIRLLVKSGAEVKVIMTKAATKFIAPITLATLSNNPVLVEFTDDKGQWNSHVELGLWADLFLIAPASANTISKFANGVCDNLLSATYLSARCPVWVAPAMDVDMWKHPATQRNIENIKSFGNHLISVTSGELASGLVGEGRMEEPQAIHDLIQAHFTAEKSTGGLLKGKRILITAGPTMEPIDPVRFISNHSSGKMGIELAERLYAEGAEVTLVKGPTNLNTVNKKINVLPVTTAQEMYDASLAKFKDVDIAILAAAVSDFTPMERADKKIKKSASTLTLQLQKTKDILKTLGTLKKENQILVGFALETDNELENATSKLKSKNLDMIVLNSLRDKGAGFGKNTNKVTILLKNGEQHDYALKSKAEVATDITNELLKLINV